MGIEFRSEYLAISQTGCVNCCGLGHVRNNPEKTCGCVWRSIARAVLRKFKECAVGDSLHPVELDSVRQTGRRAVGFVRNKQNYCADVYLTAKRHLSASHWDIFRLYFLLGADYKLCGRRLGINRGMLFHAVYNIEEQMGRVWATLAPYPLYPCKNYFSVTDRPVDVSPLPVPEPRYPNGQPLRPPLSACVAVPLRRAGGRPRLDRPLIPKPAPRPAPPAPEPIVLEHIILDITNESAVLSQVRIWYSAGQTQGAIATALNHCGAVTRTGCTWTGGSIHWLLCPKKQAA
jgi:hypothetical protein